MILVHAQSVKVCPVVLGRSDAMPMCAGMMGEIQDPKTAAKRLQMHTRNDEIESRNHRERRQAAGVGQVIRRAIERAQKRVTGGRRWIG